MPDTHCRLRVSSCGLKAGIAGARSFVNILEGAGVFEFDFF